MDKCIKVLIPTGEVRLERSDKGLYFPVSGDSISYERIDKFAGDKFDLYEATQNKDYVGEWLMLSVEGDGMVFPVIAQYGDEFPV